MNNTRLISLIKSNGRTCNVTYETKFCSCDYCTEHLISVYYSGIAYKRLGQAESELSQVDKTLLMEILL